MNALFQPHRLTLATGDICFYTAGERGSPVVLLHGGGTDAALLSWRLALPALADQHRVWAPDWPGYDQSDPFPNPADYTNDQFIATLHALLDHWGLQQASLIGVSMGGGVALGYTLRYPDRVSKLVLVDSYGLQDRAPFHALSQLMVRWPGAIRASWAVLRRSRWLTGLAVRQLFHNPQVATPALVAEVFAAIRQSAAEHAFYAWQRHELQPAGLRTVYMPQLAAVRAPR